MKRLFLTILALLFSQTVIFAEEIHFDNEIYKLKFSALAPSTQGYGNEYFKTSENEAKWTKMIGVYYYPKENNPIKYAQDFDNTIEKTENSVLLKFVENKKSDKSVISFLVNGCENSKKYFEYDLYKFEKSSTSGMVVVKYASKYFFEKDSEIVNIAKNIKENNDKYLTMIINSPTAQIVEKDINLD
jgi:hypothetical protein